MQFADQIEHLLRNMTQYENFHKTHKSKRRVLETTKKFDCVEGVPPAIIHNCDLGVTLKMLRSIFSGDNEIGTKISKDCISAIDFKSLETNQTRF